MSFASKCFSGIIFHSSLGIHFVGQITDHCASTQTYVAGLTSVSFGELCPRSLQLKCKQQYFISQGTYSKCTWINSVGFFFFFNVKCCRMWLAVFEMCTGICRFFVWLFVKYCFKMASHILSVHAPFPSCAQIYLCIHTPDNCHVAKHCANGCIDIMFSLTLIVSSHLLKNFALF